MGEAAVFSHKVVRFFRRQPFSDIMNEEVIKLIRSSKALAGKSVAEVVRSERYIGALERLMQAQATDRKAVRKFYEDARRAGKAMKLPAHVCDKCLNVTAAEFAEEFLLTFNATSPRPRAEREYINQLGTQAYDEVITEILEEEFPADAGRIRAGVYGRSDK